MKVWFLILLSLFGQLSFGVNKGPEILRICRDNDTKTATIYWQNVPDLCNSFRKYVIYYNEFGGSWKFADSINNLSVTSYSRVVDISATFKIVTYSACNGLDSFVSNVQSIDQNMPSYLMIDSVSFDYSTQKISVGWKKNPSADTKGYWLYNFKNSVYDKILETDKTTAILNDFDKTNPSFFSLASFDSCNLFAPIDSAHKAVYLSAKLDTCNQSIDFIWNKYKGEGWTNINQYLMINKNNTGFNGQIPLQPNQVNHFINGITLGDNLCYYVRTEEITTKKTSSSNTICFITKKPAPPKINYLNNVTVDSDVSIKLNFTEDNSADTDSLIIEKQENSSGFMTFMRIKFETSKPYYEIEDFSVNIDNASYSYRVKTIDKCRSVSSVSNIGKSILLLKPTFKDNKYEFIWSLYNGWEKGISNQTIEISENRSTWNFLENKNNSTMMFTYSKEKLISDSLCFRIKDHEETNSYNLSSTSTSNIECVYAISSFFIPGTINPYSNNNLLKIYGKGIDNSRGRIEIYNRWGEKLFETENLEEGWDGKINNEYAPLGSYMYKASFYDQLNNYYLRTGSVFIIR